MKILIIEDEYALLRTIEEFLLSEKYVVEKETDYLSGIEIDNVYGIGYKLTI